MKRENVAWGQSEGIQIHLVFTCIQITSEQKMLVELRESNNRSQTMTNSVGDRAKNAWKVNWTVAVGEILFSLSVSSSVCVFSSHFVMKFSDISVNDAFVCSCRTAGEFHFDPVAWNMRRMWARIHKTSFSTKFMMLDERLKCFCVALLRLLNFEFQTQLKTM